MPHTCTALQWQCYVNPMAFRKAKIAYNFGLSECNRVKKGNTIIATSGSSLAMAVLLPGTFDRDLIRHLASKCLASTRLCKEKSQSGATPQPWAGAFSVKLSSLVLTSKQDLSIDRIACLKWCFDNHVADVYFLKNLNTCIASCQ